jgi:hypothetical protein
MIVINLSLKFIRLVIVLRSKMAIKLYNTYCIPSGLGPPTGSEAGELRNPNSSNRIDRYWIGR